MPSTNLLRKAINQSPYLLVLCLAIVQFSCDSGNGSDPCEGFPIDVYSERIGFQIVDADGTSLIGTTNTPYNSSDVTVKNTNGEQVFGFVIGEDGSFGFYIVDDGEEINTEFSKEFYLVLPPTSVFPEQDIDTIGVGYKIVNNGCSREYDFLEMKYNDLIYPTQEDLTSWEFIK